MRILLTSLLTRKSKVSYKRILSVDNPNEVTLFNVQFHKIVVEVGSFPMKMNPISIMFTIDLGPTFKRENVLSGHDFQILNKIENFT